ncbi:MAG TPA: Xan family putative trans-acting RiPP leader peptide [Myxococcaceae bacterium]|nr:Xan family putative trans-acting RiPP leader peptide [Myxococcaceae bacterium]
MSDDRIKAESTPSTHAEPPGAAPVSAAPEAVQTAGEKLDSVEEIDFLLEEIESKIAPLALA